MMDGWGEEKIDVRRRLPLAPNVNKPRGRKEGEDLETQLEKKKLKIASKLVVFMLCDLVRRRTQSRTYPTPPIRNYVQMCIFLWVFNSLTLAT